MSKNCNTVVVDFDEYTSMEFREVSAYWIKNAFGEKVYFLTRSRELAIQTCDDLYGRGQYVVSSGKMQKNSGTNTVRASLNSKSRAGSRPVK